MLLGFLGYYCPIKNFRGFFLHKFQQKYSNCMASKTVTRESETVAYACLSNVPRCSYTCWVKSAPEGGSENSEIHYIRWVIFNFFPCCSPDQQAVGKYAYFLYFAVRYPLHRHPIIPPTQYIDTMKDHNNVSPDAHRTVLLQQTFVDKLLNVLGQKKRFSFHWGTNDNSSS